jgi:hypothetical protein
MPGMHVMLGYFFVGEGSKPTQRPIATSPLKHRMEVIGLSDCIHTDMCYLAPRSMPPPYGALAHHAIQSQ